LFGFTLDLDGPSHQTISVSFICAGADNHLTAQNLHQ